MTVCDINAFVLKRALWIAPRNELNVYRLLLWVGTCTVPSRRTLPTGSA